MVQPIIKIGSTGAAVKYLQQSLNKLGYNPGPIDGILGTKTNIAVRSFQKSKGLIVDGIVANNTWVAIEKALKLLRTIKTIFHLEKTKNMCTRVWVMSISLIMF